jgi:carboxypeptidase T
VELVRIKGSRADLLAVGDLGELHIVGSSAIDRGDGSWLVSVYVPDEHAIERLRERGLVVERLKPPEQVRSEFAAAAASGGYLSSAALTDRLRSLASAHADVCELELLANRTHEGREVHALRIGKGASIVVILGGVHAREWAPPDALLSFAEALVGAYAGGGSLEHPEWADETADLPITYAAWSVPAADVKRLVDGVTLVLVPLVNPDGRDFTLAGRDDLHFMWRKNRRPAAPRHPGPWCVGVDLNRNYDIAWDFERYYTAEAASQVQSSKQTCDPQIFIGPSAASEPETQNMQALVERLRPSHFMDVHSYARDILFPWGMDDDQARDPTENFHNPDWDRQGPHHGRDGAGGSYGEYLPSTLAARNAAIARRMRDAIRDQAGRNPTARHRSIYTVKQALGLYPTTGTSDDYCTALTMLDGSRPPIAAFTLECGIDQAPDDPTDNEGGFHPDYTTKFPKIEREVHAAVLALVRDAAGA